MRIVELNVQDFEEFANNHPLRNYCQTLKYGKFMGEKGYNFDLIGFQDDSNNLVAASLILIKKVGMRSKYAYAPKGFLIDYYNKELFKVFISKLKDFYSKRDVVFIKINPEIIIGDIAIKNGRPVYNQNVELIDQFKDLGFKRRREIKPLDFIFPRINPYINLKKYDFNKLSDDVKNKINNAKRFGFCFEKVSSKEINEFYGFIKDFYSEDITYFRNFLNYFGEDAEFLLLKIDYEDYLVNARNMYEKELEHNNECNEIIQEDNSEDNLNNKMQSDRDLLLYKNYMIEATDGLRRNKYKYVGGVITLKHLNRVSIIALGYDSIEANLFPGYYMYSEIIERYKNNFDFIDLNGISSDFLDNKDFANFNNEKLAFKPTIYEFIGEFDYIINEADFKRLQSKIMLSKEFNSFYKIK